MNGSLSSMLTFALQARGVDLAGITPASGEAPMRFAPTPSATLTERLQRVPNLVAGEDWFPAGCHRNVMLRELDWFAKVLERLTDEAFELAVVVTLRLAPPAMPDYVAWGAVFHALKSRQRKGLLRKWLDGSPESARLARSKRWP